MKRPSDDDEVYAFSFRFTIGEMRRTGDPVGPAEIGWCATLNKRAIPGVYASEEAARFACSFTHDELNSVILDEGQIVEFPITLETLEALEVRLFEESEARNELDLFLMVEDLEN